MNSLRIIWITFFLLVTGILGVKLAGAQVTVAGTATSIGGGNYRYDYTLTNVGSTPIWSFSIDTGSAPSHLVGPTGWSSHVITISNRRIVQWVSMTQVSDLQPSSSLGNFSITSLRTPGMVAFRSIDETPNIFDEGQTTGPAFVGSQLANISTRLNVGTGENVLIGGFIVTGTHTKKVLIRGLGPSLASAGLTGLIADPLLVLHDSQRRIIASNDNWRDSTAEADIVDSTIPPTNSKEAAIVMSLAPGAYTVILQSASGGHGIGLIEIYDLDRVADSKLANISTRGLVQTEANVLIGGLIIQGTNATKVIVRAIGPSLTHAGLTGVLLDPTLELHNAQGLLVASNDNWKTSLAAIQSTGIPPTDDRESAILKTLSPGRYTAIVRGKNNSTGLALVEVYQLNN